jgi:hypothetical protein
LGARNRKKEGKSLFQPAHTLHLGRTALNPIIPHKNNANTDPAIPNATPVPATCNAAAPPLGVGDAVALLAPDAPPAAVPLARALPDWAGRVLVLIFPAPALAEPSVADETTIGIRVELTPAGMLAATAALVEE